MDRLDAMRAFVRVVDTRGFTKASYTFETGLWPPTAARNFLASGRHERIGKRARHAGDAGKVPPFRPLGGDKATVVLRFHGVLSFYPTSFPTICTSHTLRGF
jgi:hypothetical protein